MAFKNRKKNYPLYETTMFENLRVMTENVAERFPDRNAITYKVKPTSKVCFTTPTPRAEIISAP